MRVPPNRLVATHRLYSDTVIKDVTQCSCAPLFHPQAKERERAATTLEKFTSIYRRLSTEQVLFQHNLGQENLLKLCNKPSKLLLNLFSHESILKRVLGTSIVENLPGMTKQTKDF